MLPQLEYSILTQDSEDIQQLITIIDQCFVGFPGSEAYINLVGVENFRIIRQSRQIMGGLAAIPMSQWFGGERVPMTGIAAVGIAPEYRGGGVAIAMLEHTVRELYDNGVPISVLYPATQRLYRKAGYEQAGIYSTWEIPTQTIQVREQPLPLKPLVPINLEAFYPIYEQQARLINGHLDRNTFHWQRLIQSKDKETVYAYLIGEIDKPEGYLIFTQDNGILQIRDWAILTRDAARSFWSFLANHRSQIEQIQWYSSSVDSLSLLLPEQTAKIISQFRWFLRVIDVVKALEKRGYPLGISVELHLDIRDNLIPENNSKFTLSVSNGRGEVSQGGNGDLQLDIRGLAPLYTGLFTPYQLQLAGQLAGTETALLAASQIFAGVSPWMPDFF
ncbi:GNAT family N-acetyltransferase [Limnofasciculus baicalensis]|uniref:GNAT family N-acetyltransferase n=1 Tax=Limnofasciculus baicalensis BBK-W-15 TaxID=2699891 RepID=A0AAE3KPZ2_9CYAN|nr:GNAT family N-acetyltransferase [Limnofasciculus baicalensis]MCP2731326.1 GNAT family N-acetyltransferase [Limnofasciculus baicalensis BBK-W-15]